MSEGLFAYKDHFYCFWRLFWWFAAILMKLYEHKQNWKSQFFYIFCKKTGSMVWYKVNANIFYYFCLFKPKFLLIPFRISHFYGWKQQKTNQNLQYDNRSTLTTGKVSADFSWFFISNGGVLGSCYCLVSTHWISINVILSHFKNVK